MSPSGRILYTETHRDTRDYVACLLSLADYEVVTTESALSALQLARQEHFDLYLLDTRLPDVSGFELCERIREFDSRTPVLFYSAAAFEKDKERALLSGAQAYLTKPDAAFELRHKIIALILSSPKIVNG
jgi:DNA-binding response OmpR family regulator